MSEATVELVAASTVSEPITRAEAKQHLGLASATTAHDAYIDGLIVAARSTFEGDTGFVCGVATFRQWYDAWPRVAFELYKRPVLGVTSIQYVNASGVLVTLSPATYVLDAQRTQPLIRLGYDKTWPEVRADKNAVQVTYTAGYETVAGIPQDIKQALLLLVGQWFENRTEISDKQPGHNGYQRIADRYMRSNYP